MVSIMPAENRIKYSRKAAKYLLVGILGALSAQESDVEEIVVPREEVGAGQGVIGIGARLVSKAQLLLPRTSCPLRHCHCPAAGFGRLS